jgi:hypothetical protein
VGIVNPTEAITAGDVIIPRMPPSGQRPRRDDAFAIIQLFARGLTLHGGNTQKIWNRSEKMKKTIWTALGPNPNSDLLLPLPHECRHLFNFFHNLHCRSLIQFKKFRSTTGSNLSPQGRGI